MKQLVLANARILYGSESRKFFGTPYRILARSPTNIRIDFVTARDIDGKYICVLVCSLDGFTRILRKETNVDPLGAARALADGLVKDTGMLFCKSHLHYYSYPQTLTPYS